MNTTRHILMLIVLGALISIAVFIACEETPIQSPLPTDQGCPLPLDSTISVPAPGMGGIVLTPGPELVFQIDLGNPHHKGLFWDRYRRLFRGANVKIVIEIDEAGDVIRYDPDLSDDDYQPAAFDSVWAAVKTWRYQGGCLQGKICFVFNPSSKRIMIDDSGLNPVPGYEDCRIKRKLLHGVYRKSSQHQFFPVPGRCR